MKKRDKSARPARAGSARKPFQKDAAKGTARGARDFRAEHARSAPRGERPQRRERAQHGREEGPRGRVDRIEREGSVSREGRESRTRREGPKERGFSDPYQRVQRPTYAGRERYGERLARPYRRSDADEGGGGASRPHGFAGRAAGGFTVTLDPDVARVFRGDASVNKALRLVLQLMQVVQGPPPRTGGYGGRPERGDRTAPPRSGYQGSAQARGFTRKPRFQEEQEEPEEPEEPDAAAAELGDEED